MDLCPVGMAVTQCQKHIKSYVLICIADASKGVLLKHPVMLKIF